MAKNNHANKKQFKGGDYVPNGSRNGSTRDKNYKYGNKPSGNAYKTEGGYRNAGTAGIIPKVPDSIGSGKFGASADVPKKLTFGQFASTQQPGFLNDIHILNNIRSGSAGVSSSFSFNNAAHQYTGLSQYLLNAERTAGVLAVRVNDYLGANNNEEKSPLNLAAQLTKQFIDTSLGEQLSFSSSDLGVYMGAVKSLWDFTCHIKRCINLSHNSKNRADYMTRGVYRALHICKEGHPVGNPDPTYEIAAKSAIYLERMNAMIKRINTVPVPVSMKWLVSYTDACYSQVFQDEPGETAQLYVVIPNGFYRYDETATHDPTDPQWRNREFYNGASLEWIDLYTQVADGYNSIPELLDLLEIMVQAVTTHTNSDAMAQKLLNAFGTANTLQIPTNQISDELVPVVYDEDFLSSLENAKIVKGLITPSYDIDAAREMIIGRPLFEIATDGGYSKAGVSGIVNLPLQFHSGLDKVDDHAISNALRWHPYTSFVRYNSDSTKLEFDFANNFGMQIVTGLEVTYLIGADRLDTFNVAGHWQLLENASVLNDFKHFPIGIIFDDTKSTINASGTDLKYINYNARRDIELAMNGEIVANYFWALSEMVWDVVDGQTTFTGQRNKMG